MSSQRELGSDRIFGELLRGLRGLRVPRLGWPLPDEARARRLRAVRDGLIVAGWLATAFLFLVIVPAGRSLGFDAWSYWSVDVDELYRRTFDSNYTLGAFRYTPPIGLLLAPLAALPWWLFLWLYAALLVATLVWLGGRWTLALLAVPFVALELYHGNVHLLLAAAIALGFRHPWAWSFVLLTKVTPGIGLLWFAVRREWRSLGIALGVTGLLAAAVLAVAPNLWLEWWLSLLSNVDEPQPFSIPPPLPVRLPIAAAIVVWGARTDRPWTVPVAATLALPILWFHGLSVLLATVPSLRHRIPEARTYAVIAAASLAVALASVALAGTQIEALLREASLHLRIL